MILAIDTSAGTSVALIENGEVRAEITVEDNMRHAEVIGETIAEPKVDGPSRGIAPSVASIVCHSFSLL